MDDKYLGKFIIEAGKVAFTTADGRKWLMRQPRPEEAADGDSAYRLAHFRVMDDTRLASLAGSLEALKREANIRASTAEAVYMLPILLENEAGEKAFNVFDNTSLQAFEELPQAIIIEMGRIYWDQLQQAIADAKKK